MTEKDTFLDKEQRAFFTWFCSYICILNAKKLNLPNILLLVLKNPVYKSLLKYMMGFSTDYEVVQYFIQYDPSICKSKYMSKFLNSPEFKKIQPTLR